MTHCVTPRSLNALIIFESWPTRNQTISSTSDRQFRVGFAFERDGDDFAHPCFARFRRDQERKSAAACDNSETSQESFILFSQRFQDSQSAARRGHRDAARLSAAERLKEERSNSIGKPRKKSISVEG